MANLHARELGDDLDVLVMSDIPDICVPIMHWGQEARWDMTNQTVGIGATGPKTRQPKAAAHRF